MTFVKHLSPVESAQTAVAHPVSASLMNCLKSELGVENCAGNVESSAARHNCGHSRQRPRASRCTPLPGDKPTKT